MSEEQFQDTRKELIKILNNGLSELGKISSKNVTSWMEYRRSIFLASITIIILITPFADDYTNSLQIFWIGFFLLFVSIVVGLITEEVRHWVSHQIYEYAKKYSSKAIEKLLKSSTKQDMDGAQKIFLKSGDLPANLKRISSLCMFFSTAAMTFFIMGLVLVFISILPQ